MKVVAFNGSPREQGNTAILIRHVLDALSKEGFDVEFVQLGGQKIQGGQIHAFDSINHFFLISETIIPGSSYWNHGICREPGDVENDAEGIRTMTTLAKNMAWLLKKINSCPPLANSPLSLWTNN